MSFIRLGIDYGTSFSKIVIRDSGAAGGEKAYVTSETWRIPSAVVCGRDFLLFGTSPQTLGLSRDLVLHESVKMRVAGEEKDDLSRYCYAPIRKLPDGLSAKDLAALTVWYLISKGVQAADKHLSRRGTSAKTSSATGVRIVRKGLDRNVGFTMGIPMSLYDDIALRGVFLDIARTAYQLYTSDGCLEGDRVGLATARAALDRAREAVAKLPPVPADDVRSWIRTEAEAALAYPFQSAAVADGPYAQIDIGAGTTNVSVFRIVPEWVNGVRTKKGVAFFSASSPPIGMDAVDSALFTAGGKRGEHCLALRGAEERLVKQKEYAEAALRVGSLLQQQYRAVLASAFKTHLQNEMERRSWHGHSIFFVGGGSQLELLTTMLAKYPLTGTDAILPRVDQEPPSDLVSLVQGKSARELLPFISIAYGLSFDVYEIPLVETPSEVPEMVLPAGGPQSFKPHGEWYEL